MCQYNSRERSGNRSGQAAVEFLFFMPILALSVVMMMKFGHFYQLKTSSTNLARRVTWKKGLTKTSVQIDEEDATTVPEVKRSPGVDDINANFREDPSKVIDPAKFNPIPDSSIKFGDQPVTFVRLLKQFGLNKLDDLVLNPEGKRAYYRFEVPVDEVEHVKITGTHYAEFNSWSTKHKGFAELLNELLSGVDHMDDTLLEETNDNTNQQFPYTMTDLIAPDSSNNSQDAKEDDTLNDLKETTRENTQKKVDQLDTRTKKRLKYVDEQIQKFYNGNHTVSNTEDNIDSLNNTIDELESIRDDTIPEYEEMIQEAKKGPDQDHGETNYSAVGIHFAEDPEEKLESLKDQINQKIDDIRFGKQALETKIFYRKKKRTLSETNRIMNQAPPESIDQLSQQIYQLQDLKKDLQTTRAEDIPPRKKKIEQARAKSGGMEGLDPMRKMNTLESDIEAKINEIRQRIDVLQNIKERKKQQSQN